MDIKYRLFNPPPDFETVIKAFMHQHVVGQVLSMLPRNEMKIIPYISSTLVDSLIHLSAERDIHFLLNWTLENPDVRDPEQFRDSVSFYLDSTHYTHPQTLSGAILATLQSLLPPSSEKSLDIVQHWELLREFFLLQVALDKPHAPLLYLTMQPY